MKIVLNGEARSLDPEATVSELIAALDLTERRIAVEVNEQIIPRSRHAHQVLTDGDRVEIVHAIGGG